MAILLRLHCIHCLLQLLELSPRLPAHVSPQNEFQLQNHSSMCSSHQPHLDTMAQIYCLLTCITLLSD